MRVKVILKSTNGSDFFSIDKDFRMSFISFFKSIFDGSPKFKELYGNKKQFSPFCSSLYLGKILGFKDNGIQFKPNSTLFFSTGEYDIYSYYINGCLFFKNDNRTIGFGNNQELSISKILPIPDAKPQTKKIVIKSMSPMVVQNACASTKDFDNYYLTPEKKEFQDMINIITQKRMKHLGFYNYNNIDIYPIKFRTEHPKHFGGYLKASKGIFEISSSVETLQFLYDYGIGNRTGQLFGMFEVL